MNVNKKLGRWKQYASEKMGKEIQTDVSEEFKALETEMDLRYDGMCRLQTSMKAYTKSMNNKIEGEGREKQIPVGYLGSSMVAHGGDFEPDSEFGTCLTALGRANERIARIQESYAGNASSSWLESVDRSVIQMKEYQASRKRLEQRRLAYDTSLAKMQKAKREDYRVEEELRSQRTKYEDSSEEVYRRMQDVKEAEADSVIDLTAFLDAELEYYEQCREVLLRLREEWPASGAPAGYHRRTQRSRSNTYAERLNPADEPPRPTISSSPSYSSIRGPSPRRYADGPEPLPPRPNPVKASTFEVADRFRRDESPAPRTLSRVPSEPPVLSAHSIGRDRSVSPATSHGSAASRSASYAIQEANNAIAAQRKTVPPPPPPSRAKKPPPPPPPMKRSALSSYEMS